MPKREIFGMYRAQALQIGRLNTRGTILSRKILFSKKIKRLGCRRTITNLRDEDGRVSEVEELVHARNEENPNETDDPSTEGR